MAVLPLLVFQRKLVSVVSLNNRAAFMNIQSIRLHSSPLPPAPPSPALNGSLTAEVFLSVFVLAGRPTAEAAATNVPLSIDRRIKLGRTAVVFARGRFDSSANALPWRRIILLHRKKEDAIDRNAASTGISAPDRERHSTWRPLVCGTRIHSRINEMENNGMFQKRFIIKN